MTEPDTPPEVSPDEAPEMRDAADPVAQARELIERGDYRRARRALAAVERACLDERRVAELAQLRAAVGIDPVAVGLAVAGALTLLVVVVLLAL